MNGELLFKCIGEADDELLQRLQADTSNKAETNDDIAPERKD